jgi:uncharacterized protein (UPF0210 family)
MVGSTIDAAVNVAEAGVDVAAAGANFGESIAEGVAAAGAEFVGEYEARDAIDEVRAEARDDFWQNVDDAGTNLSEAYTDVVGD